MIEAKKSLFNFDFTNVISKDKSTEQKTTNKISVSQLNQPDYFLNSVVAKDKVNKYSFVDDKKESSKQK